MGFAPIFLMVSVLRVRVLHVGIERRERLLLQRGQIQLGFLRFYLVQLRLGFGMPAEWDVDGEKAEVNAIIER